MASPLVPPRVSPLASSPNFPTLRRDIVDREHRTGKRDLDARRAFNTALRGGGRKKKKKKKKSGKKKKKGSKTPTLRVPKNRSTVVLGYDWGDTGTYFVAEKDRQGRFAFRRRPSREVLTRKNLPPVRRVFQTPEPGAVLVEWDEASELPSTLLDVGSRFAYAESLPDPASVAHDKLFDHGFVIVPGVLPQELCEEALGEKEMWSHPSGIFGSKWPVAHRGRTIVEAEPSGEEEDEHGRKTVTSWKLAFRDEASGRASYDDQVYPSDDLTFAVRQQKSLNQDHRRLGKESVWPGPSHLKTKRARDAVRRIFGRVLNAVRRTISPGHVPKQPVTLTSPPGQRRQYAHRDYNSSVCRPRRADAATSSSYFRPRKASYGIIVALEKGTRFVCWPGSHQEFGYTCPKCEADMEEDVAAGGDYVCPECGTTVNPRLSCPQMGGVYAEDAVGLELEPGSILIFADTLVHAGASYDTLNRRMHFYCDPVREVLDCRERESARECYDGACIYLPGDGKKKNKGRCVLRNPNETYYASEARLLRFSDRTSEWVRMRGDRNSTIPEEGPACFAYKQPRRYSSLDECARCKRPYREHVNDLYDAFLQTWDFETFRRDPAPYTV